MKQLCLSIYTVHDLQSKYIDTMIGDENIKICRASVFKLLRRSQNSFLQNNTNTLVINTSSDFLVFETFRTSLEQNFAIFIKNKSESSKSRGKRVRCRFKIAVAQQPLPLVIDSTSRSAPQTSSINPPQPYTIYNH
jgi:hypothetical protein